LKSNTIIGYEALLRDASKLQVSPVDIFKEAEKKGLQNVLDLISIETAYASFKDRASILFLNIFPTTLLWSEFLSWWDEHIQYQDNIALELLENKPINDWKRLKEVTKELQSRGVKIVIDDLGGGYSFLQQWIELSPDYIKLDKYFAENLSQNFQKQKALKSLVELLSDTTEIIIEGIERKEDLYVAESAGIHYAQGYLLGRPLPDIGLVGSNKVYESNKIY